MRSSSKSLESAWHTKDSISTSSPSGISRHGCRLDPKTDMVTPVSNILLPLYIYPLPGAWEPLYRAIWAYPQLNFTIILNPHNGPGVSPLPDDSYATEISKLNSLPNVCTIGYVRINYCKRRITDVREDVTKYAGWSADYPRSGLAVHGIFFDETPNKFSENASAYLDRIIEYVKAEPGILGDKLVIHNPGTVPDVSLGNPGPDVMAVVEESYRKFQSVEVQKRLSSHLRYDWGRCCYIVHSVPRSQLKQLVLELRHRGRYLFVTELSRHCYVRFAPGWDEFVEAMQME